MALTDATLESLGNSLSALATHISLHTADPGTAGVNETTAGRLSAPWVVSSGGDLTLSSPLNFTGGAPNGPVTYVGLWSAATGGTFRGGFALVGDTSFNSSGEYTVSQLTINGTSN